MRSVIEDALDVDSYQSYAPCGKPLEWGTFGSPFAFTGEMMDDNGLVYLRARYYSPALAVFTGLDPVENLNRYQYVNANPVNMVDPNGLSSEDPGQWDQCRQSDPCDGKCCGPEVTVWLYREIKRHVEYAQTALQEEFMPYSYEVSWDLGPISIPVPVGNSPSEIMAHNEMALIYNVRILAIYGLAVLYGYVDYKALAEESDPSYRGEYSCHGTDASLREATVTLCGQCVNSTDFGNFILGAVIFASGEGGREVATAAGQIFNRVFSSDAAGASGADTRGVEWGYDFMQQNLLPDPFSIGHFCDSIMSRTDWLEGPYLHQGDSPEGCTNCPCPGIGPSLILAHNSIPNYNQFLYDTLPLAGSPKPYQTPEAWFDSVISDPDTWRSLIENFLG